MLETPKSKHGTEKWLFAGLVFFLAAAAPPAPPARAQVTDAELLEQLSKLKTVREGGRELVEVKLRDVLKIALERSTVVKASQIGEQVAQRVLAAAGERNNPTLTNSLTQLRGLSTSNSGGSPTLVGADVNTLATEYAKKQNNGITWSLKASRAQTSAAVVSLDSTSPPTEISVSALTASVAVPIFQDFGSDLGALPVRRGELGVSRSQLLTRQEADSVLRTIAFVYWNLVAVLENITVQQESVTLSEQLLRDNRERLRAGVLSPADVKVTETQLARDRQALLRLQNEALRIEDQARAALNLEFLQTGLKPVDVPQVREAKYRFGEAQEKAFRNDPTIGLLNDALADNGFNLLEARNQGKTNLDFSLSYTFNDYNEADFPAAGSFSQSDLAGYGATLTWTLPLFDRQAPEKIQQRLLERAQLELRLRDLKTSLSIRLQSELRSFDLNKQEVQTARVSVSLAEELLQNEIERFKLGRSTSFQVAQFQRDAALARQQEILSRVRFENTFLELLSLTGDIYSFFGLPEPPVRSPNPVSQ